MNTNQIEAGVYKFCQVHTNLELASEKEFELKNKKSWQEEANYLATSTVNVIVGSADRQKNMSCSSRIRGTRGTMTEYQLNGTR